MQHPAIKAIETTYKGCRFRSRLEARWAVFFDTLGVRWEYEPEGFELPSGRYLPDFRLDLWLWLEVKALPPSEADEQRFRELCAGTQRRGVIVVGAPHCAEWISIDSEGDQVDRSDGAGRSAYSGEPLQSVLWLNALPRTLWATALVDASSARFEFGATGAAR